MTDDDRKDLTMIPDTKAGAVLGTIAPERRTYAETTSYAILMLLQAVESAMNRNDRPVIEELKRLCNEIFAEAERALAEMEAEKKVDFVEKSCEN